MLATVKLFGGDMPASRLQTVVFEIPSAGYRKAPGTLHFVKPPDALILF